MNLPPIIDSHHRLNASAARPAALAALLAESGVERSVLVQPEPSLDGTRAALALADKAEFVAGAAVWADVESVALGALLDELGANPKLRGVCLPAHLQESNHWLAQDAVLAGLREVAKRGLSLDVIVEPRQIPSVRVLAEAVPDLRIALAHIGSPYIARGEREPWGVYILNLAAMRNVSVKISASSHSRYSTGLERSPPQALRRTHRAPVRLFACHVRQRLARAHSGGRLPRDAQRGDRGGRTYD